MVISSRHHGFTMAHVIDLTTSGHRIQGACAARFTAASAKRLPSRAATVSFFRVWFFLTAMQQRGAAVDGRTAAKIPSLGMAGTPLERQLNLGILAILKEKCGDFHG